MVTATIVLSRLGPSTATIRIASTRPGTAMIRSIARVITTSTHGLENAATSPRITPRTNDTHITVSPMNSDTRAP